MRALYWINFPLRGASVLWYILVQPQKDHSHVWEAGSCFGEVAVGSPVLEARGEDAVTARLSSLNVLDNL